jgi:exonuclease SbcC
MIKLQSIRIRNFRAIADVTFKPLTEGITGISGSNGAGKTSFLSATMFALFGEKPPEASVASLRRTGSTGECSVSVVFTHLKQTVEVVREIKGKSNTILVDIYVDGVPETVTSVGAANLWISQRLGVDAAGFLTAFVIRQKELDQLITARPAERKRIIERLAGIDTINHALKAARDDENNAKKILGNLPGSESNVEESEEQLNMLADKMVQLEANWESEQKQQRELTAKQRELQSSVDTMRDIEFSVSRKESELSNLVNEVSNLESRNEKLAYLDQVSDIGDIQSLRDRHLEVTRSLNEKSQNLASYKVKQDNTKNTLIRIQKELLSQTTALSMLTVPSESLETLRTKLEDNSGAESGIITRQSVLRSKIADLEASISVLEHSTDCPTCHTELADPAGLVGRFQDEARTHREDISKLEEERQQLIVDNQSTQSLIAASQEYERISESIKSLNSEVDSLQKEDDSSIIEKLESEVEALEADKTTITELGFKAKSINEDTVERNSNIARLREIAQLSSTLENEISGLKKNFSADRLSKLRIELVKVQQASDAKAPLIESLSNDRSATNSKLAMSKTNYKNAKDQWDRKKDLMHQQQRLALTTDMIDKYRSNTISSLAPSLSEYATSLISEITNGEFTEVLLDDEFNASVVDSTGNTRPVSWLSGGEVSAVALSMRIAIGLLITDGNPELLWMDEVLTAQDVDRRTAMLSMIRGLPIDQIIMINHTHEAADIVDKTISLNIDRINGSYISEDE